LSRNRSIILSAALGLALFAGSAEAQQQGSRAFTFGPYAGVFRDAYDIGANGRTGALYGIRAGYDLGTRTRLIADVGGGTASDVAATNAVNDYWVYGNRWLMTTAGVEYDAVRKGGTAVALGLQAGGGWRQVVTEDQVGIPTEPGRLASSNYAFYDAVVPSITLRQAITPRMSLTLGVSDYVFDVLEWEPDHAPAMSIGLSIR
jgi:hypothetical protein